LSTREFFFFSDVHYFLNIEGVSEMKSGGVLVLGKIWSGNVLSKSLSLFSVIQI